MFPGLYKWLVAVLVVALVASGSGLIIAQKDGKAWKEAAEKQQDTIKQLQQRQKSVAAMDEKYTKDLDDAKAEIEALRADVASGRRRLQLSAKCPKSAAGGVGDDATAGLTTDAERNYWRLRAGISTLTKQVIYLQDYINTICLK